MTGWMRGQKTVEERFWEKVDRSDGPNACWPWTAAVGSVGCGLFRSGGAGSSIRSAHRFAWELTTRQELPIDRNYVGKQFVQQRCGNDICCNPAHLYVSSFEMMRLCISRSKILTDADVVEMRRVWRQFGELGSRSRSRSGLSRKKVSEVYGVHARTVQDILSGKTRFRCPWR